MAKRQSSAMAWLVAAVVLLVVAAGGVALWRMAMHRVPTTQPTAPMAPAAVSSTPAHHPITDATGRPASTASTALPTLAASDSQVAQMLLRLAGDSGLSTLLKPDRIIPRIVATVDALPRESVGQRVLPLRSPTGAFQTAQVDGDTVIAADNAARYEPYMRVLENVDTQALVTWYASSYPLFQQAYEQLGYPHGYFNDRLIVAIDNMLAAPSPTAAPALVRPKGFYRYRDPAMQSLSAGQKLLIRSGPANEVKIKARLRAIRAALTGARLVPASSGTSAVNEQTKQTNNEEI